MKTGTVIKSDSHEYTISTQLKSGGSATVYEVKNECGFTLALKLLDQLETDKITRFHQELKFQEQNKHKHIVHILDLGNYKDGEQVRPFYVMRLYKKNLRDLINIGINPHKIVKYFTQICWAVQFAHKKKAIHRDIKPENILYDESKDIVLLADFGIAKFEKLHLTKPNQRLANFDYHAPEQMRDSGENIGTYTDVYALGLLLNEMFTKRIPYGVAYKSIRSVNPVYGMLDNLVDSMIQHSPLMRERHVSNVVSLFRFYNDKIEQRNLDIQDSLFSERPPVISIKDYRFAKANIPKDIHLADILINDENTDWNSIEANYHMNFGYNTKIATINLAIQIELLDAAESKFSYESNIYEKDTSYTPLDLNDKEDKKIYDDIYDKLNTFPISNQFDFITKKILKYCHSLENYHAREFLRYIDEKANQIRKNLVDAPLLWICYYIRDIIPLIKTHSAINEFLIEDYVRINWDRFKNKIENDDLLSWRKQADEKIENAIFEELKAKNLRFTKIKVGKGFNLIFKGLKEYKKYKEVINSLASRFNPSDIIQDDARNLLRISDSWNSFKTIRLGNFDFYSVLRRLLGIDSSGEHASG